MYGPDIEMLGLGSLGCWGVVSLVVLLLTVLYLSTLAKAVGACSPARRTIDPRLVWLNLVPVFHLVWKFWTSAQVGKTLQQEYDARGMRTGHSFGRAVGVIIPGVAILTRFVFWGGMFFAEWVREREFNLLVVMATLLLGLIEMTLLIVHWAQISNFARPLEGLRPLANDADVADDGGEREFDEDYRPVSRKKRRVRGED